MVLLGERGTPATSESLQISIPILTLCQCCYSLDRNTIHHRFDLTHEDGVRRYIAFLSKIEEHGRELRERFEAVKPALLERMKTEKGRASLRWTAQSQLEDHGLEPEQLAEEMPRDVMEALAEYTANTT